MNEKNKKKTLILILTGFLITLSFFFFSFKIVKAQEFQQPIYEQSRNYGSGSVVVGEILTEPAIATTTFKITAIEFATNIASFGNCAYDGSGEDCFILFDSTDNGGTFSDTGDAVPFAVVSQFTQSTSQDRKFSLAKPCIANQGGVGTTCNLGETSTTTAYITVGTGERLYFTLGQNFVNTIAHGTINSGAYEDGFLFDDLVGGTLPLSQSGNTLKELYFKIWNEDQQIIGQNQIQITFPQNGQALLDSEFPRWGVQYNYATTTPNATFIGVRYGTSTTQTNGILDAQYVDSSPLYIQGNASTTINKTNFPPIGDYYAQAFIRVIPSSGTLQPPYYIATSTIIQFSLLSQGDPLNPPFLDCNGIICTEVLTDEDCANITFNIFSSENWNNFIACLFQPSDTALNRIQNNIGLFKNLFPFSIYFTFNTAVQDSINENIATSTYPSFTLDLSGFLALPPMTILSPTGMEDLLGTDLKNQVFNVQKNIMWLGAIGVMLIMII